MSESATYPLIVFTVSLAAQWLAAFLGHRLRRELRPLGAAGHQDIELILGAAMTLLGLIIGFSFSMAVTRYDQRKDFEAAEANAISTAFMRADFLPDPVAARLRTLLKQYLDLRVAYYTATDPRRIETITADTAKMQNQLWQTILPTVKPDPPRMELVITSINDVLSSQGNTQAGFLNRLPAGVWAIMGLVALATNVLMGINERRKGLLLLLILPVIISTSFLLIADIDNPRGGFIGVVPHNLNAVRQELGA